MYYNSSKFRWSIMPPLQCPTGEWDSQLKCDNPNKF